MAACSCLSALAGTCTRPRLRPTVAETARTEEGEGGSGVRRTSTLTLCRILGGRSRSTCDLSRRIITCSAEAEQTGAQDTTTAALNSCHVGWQWLCVCEEAKPACLLTLLSFICSSFSLQQPLAS